MAANYTYKTHTYGGVKLHIIETKASNIKLVNTVDNNGNAKSVNQTGKTGINGAFFVRTPDPINHPTQYKNMVLNIAYYHGKCLNTGVNPDDAHTNDQGHGVVGWDGTFARYHEDITDADELNFVTKSNSWAQGGVALWLGTKYWKDKFIDQIGESLLKSSALRTAMICDLGTSNKVYLIITASATTVEKFRAAIEDLFDINDDSGLASEDFQGIMLDGGSSTQMYVDDKNIGNSAAVPEHIILVNDN